MAVDTGATLMERIAARILLRCAIVLYFCPSTALAGAGQRALVELPEMMQEHMLANMRGHLAALDEILGDLAAGSLDRAADTAEHQLGLSSLEAHQASRMAPYFPKGMREAGMRMHRAASRFALVVEEGDQSKTYRALREVTAACVACHAAYRIR
jgi:hypothetical protein